MDFIKFLKEEVNPKVLILKQQRANKLPSTALQKLLSHKTDELYFQWLKNKEADPPQQYGNIEVLFRLTPETYIKYLQKADTTYSIPLFSKAPSYEAMYNVLVNKTKEKDFFMKVFKQWNMKTWKTVSEDESPFATKEDIEIITPVSKYAILVDNFETNNAKLWGNTADSNIYPLNNAKKT